MAQLIRGIHHAALKYEGIATVSMHTLSACLDRYDYCIIDRGVKINRRFAVTLDEEMASKIIEYLYTTCGIVYYSSIYESFKLEFIAS